MLKLYLSIIFFFIFKHLFEAKVNLRHSQSNKYFISQLDEGSFEIIHPFQIRDKKERIGIDTHNYFLNVTSHYKHVVIVIPSKSIAGIRLKLNLKLNDHLFVNETQFKKLDKAGELDLDSTVENCYYQGVVNNDQTSFVAISTCNGIWGVISFENGTTFGIWPLDGGDRGRRHPHVLYRTRWTRDVSCGATTQTLLTKEFQALQTSINTANFAIERIKRDFTHQIKYLELAVIGDYNFIREINATDSEGIAYMLNVLNIVDTIIFRNLRIRVSVIYAEVWMDIQRIDLHNDIQRTLNGALDYTTGHIYHIEKDASILFTGGTFANSELLSATFMSVCTARAVGIAKAVDSYAIHATAQLVSHVISHIVGIDHDSIECNCYDGSLCLMHKQIGSIGSPFFWEFSKCSIARLHNVLQSEHFQCLLSKPFQTSKLHSCGNNVIDNDEECDCGRRDECRDPCCDPITCTLKAHARCAMHQACCYQCELRPSGHVCREAQSVCDVPEMCDGISGNCPADGYFIDGVSCGINGHCWKGNCSDNEQQCKDIWGSDAKLADESCFDSNQKGVEYGNCGANRNKEFLPCNEENQKCGTLHCKDGSAVPILSNLMSFNLQFVNNGRQIQCKAIIGSESAIALVKDGTSCASGKICIENACVSLSQVSVPIQCPSNNLALQCSGHGDCTTTAICLCYDGWSGAACDVRSNTSKRIIFPTASNANEFFSTFKVSKALDTATLLGILLIAGTFLLLILICLLLCYRRKSSAELHRADGNQNKGENDFEENVNRAIKFGQMPSYREEKRKRKKNKRVYDALQRINEAAEERDSISLKSRESSTAASALNISGENSIILNQQHAKLNCGSNTNLNHINNSQVDLQNENFNYYQSNECVSQDLPINNHFFHNKHNFKRNNIYCSDSLKQYEKFEKEERKSYYNNLASKQTNNLYNNSSYNQKNYDFQNLSHDDVLKREICNSNVNLNQQKVPTNCYSSSRSDFCVNNRKLLQYTNNGENFLKKPTNSIQSNLKNYQTSERNGYATDSEAITSGFGSGSGSNSTSLRYATAGPSSDRGSFSPHFNGSTRVSNRNSAENEIIENPVTQCGNEILCEEDYLNSSSSPLPPLRLQSIQMLMKRLNTENNALNNFDTRTKLKENQFITSPNDSFELGEMFVSRSVINDHQDDNNEYELTATNINAHELKNYDNRNITSIPEPPPASTDSGHPGSNYDIQESPSLFSDTFKLDLCN